MHCMQLKLELSFKNNGHTLSLRGFARLQASAQLEFLAGVKSLCVEVGLNGGGIGWEERKCQLSV